MKIAVAMSGGVDSTVCASLLLSQGHEIHGITGKMFDGGDAVVANAQKCAENLGIPHTVVDLTKKFKESVVNPFIHEYLNGKTPSPCIRCNRAIKFGALVDSAIELGFDTIATGHYAKINRENTRSFISTGDDPRRDQSYFLFDLTQEQLSHAYFPLAKYTKDEIRAIALERELPAAKSKDSQEICFIPDDNYKHFIEENITTLPKGDIVSTNGEVFKQHDGIHRYTIGQRRGLGIGHAFPLYVVDIDPLANKIIVGAKELLLKNGLYATAVNYMKETAFKKRTVYAKIRSTHPAVEAIATIETDGRLRLDFAEPTQQISPGQAAVLYNKEGDVLAGAWIESSID